jgi:autotransporter translocation and assembly factor TamB
MRYLAVLLLILFPGVLVAQETEEERRDRGVLQAFLEDRLSDAGRSIRIEGFSGALSSRATLDSLTIADNEGVWLTLENAVLDWNRSALLGGRVEVNELSAERLVLERIPATDQGAPSPEASGFSLPELPVSIDIAQLSIDRAELGADILGQPVALSLEGAASLDEGAGVADLSVVRLDGPEGLISVSASYSNVTRDLALNLDFNEGPGGIAAGLLDLPGEPAVEFTVNGDGTLDDFTAEVRLVTDGTLRLAGEVGFGTLQNGEDDAADTRFSADIDGDIAPLLLPEYQEFFGDSVSLDVAGIRRGDGRLELERLALDSRALTLAGEIRLDAEGWPTILDIEGRITSPDGREVLLPLPGPQTFVESLDLTLQYDEAGGETFAGALEIAGLRQDDFAIERTALTGEGVIRRAEGNSVGRVNGALELDISEIALADPALVRAIGDRITGRLGFDYTGGQPLELSDFALEGEDFRLTGDAAIAGLRDDLNLAISGEVALAAEELSRFAGLTGTELTGAAEVAIDGRIEPLSGVFDLELSGSGEDLGIGNELVDPLITGAARLSGRVARDETGLRLETFSIITPATNLTATADLATGASDLRFELSVEDAGVIAPALAGPASIQGIAVQEGDDWTIDAGVSAPGGAAAQVDATVTVSDGVVGPVAGMADVTVLDLSPYSAIAGRALGGGLEVTLAGRADLRDQSFGVSVSGGSTDLQLGIPALDALLAGESELAADVARDVDGVLTVDGARFETPQLRLAADGSLGGGAGEALAFEAALPEISVLVPDLAGPARLDGTLSQTAGNWRLTADFTAPGGASGALDLAAPMDGEVIGRVTGTLAATVPDLAPYAELAGRDLGGRLALDLAGSFDPRDFSFDVEGTAGGTDLAVGIAEVDALLAGESVLQIDAASDGTVYDIERLRLETPQITATAGGRLDAADGEIAFDVELPDTAVLAPALSGPARLEGTLARTGDQLALDAEFTGPGGAEGAADVTLTLEDGTPGAVSGSLRANAADLSPYAGLAGRPLDGAVRLQVTGRGDLQAQSFDLSGTLRGEDLALGEPRVDALLAGDSRLAFDVASAGPGRYDIDLFQLETPQISADIAGALGPDDGEIAFDVTLPDASVLAPALTGAARLEGTLGRDGEALDLLADFDGPGGAEAALDVVFTLDGTTLGAVRGSVQASADDLAPYSELAGRPLDGAVDLGIEGSGDLQAMTFDVTASLRGQDLALGIDTVDTLLAGESTLSLDAASEAPGRYDIDRFRLRTPQIKADASGALGEEDGTIDFDVTLADAAIFAAGVTGDASLEGRLTRAGEALRLVADFTGPGGATGAVDVATTFDGDGLGQLQGRVEAEAASLAPYADLAGQDLSGAVSLVVEGRADPQALTFDVRIEAEAQDLALGIDTVDPLLAGRSTLSLDAARGADGVIAIDAFDLETPQLTADAAGRLDRGDGRIDFDLSLRNAGLLAPGLSGPASLRGNVARAGDEVTLQAGFSGPGGAAGTVTAEVAMEGMTPGAAELQLEARVEALSAYAGLTGLPLSGAVELAVDASGDLSELTGQASIRARGQNLRTGTAELDRLLAGTSQLSLDIRRDAAGRISISNADFASPRLSARIDGSSGPGGESLDFDIRLADIGLYVDGFNGPATARGTARSAGGDWTVNAAVTGPGGISADISGRVARDFASANLSINGVAPLAAANRFIAPNLLSGQARYDLSLNGPLALSSLSGTITASDAGLTIPSLRLRLQDLDARVSLGGGRAQVALGAALATGGRVQISGPVSLSPPFNADLTADFLNVVALDPGLYETTVNGRVTITGPLTGGVLIAGRLVLGEVEVRIPASGGLPEGDLPALTHVAEPPAVHLTRERAGLVDDDGGGGGAPGGGAAPYRLDITVSAPARIFVRGRGLDAELGGELRIGGTTANIVTSGGFELIRGRLDILGERLVLTAGSVRLQGDFDPFIRLVATTLSGDVSIEIIIEGFASRPELDINSSPDLPEEEVLARLIFKRGLGEISALQAVQLASAVNTLAGGGGGGIVDRLRSGFGLDDLDITTAEDGTAGVRAGKYLSENLYSDVTVDSTGRTEIQLNLQITPSITGRGSVDSEGETGLGIFFERDY